MWSITSKLNSTFGTIGNARADKMTWQNSEKSWEKTLAFVLNLKNLKFKHANMLQSTSAKV